MTDQIVELNRIIKKYKSVIKEHEKEIKEAQEKMSIAYNALLLLDEEKISTQDELFDTSSQVITEPLSEKYKELSMKDATSDIFMSRPTEYLSARDIYDELKKHQYMSKSKNLLRDVYVFLNKTHKAGYIISSGKTRPMKYKLPEQVLKTLGVIE